jgi:hypothetical protein
MRKRDELLDRVVDIVGVVAAISVEVVIVIVIVRVVDSVVDSGVGIVPVVVVGFLGLLPGLLIVCARRGDLFPGDLFPDGIPLHGGLGHGEFRIKYRTQQAPHAKKRSSRSRSSGVLGLLKAFAWFCGKENREQIECTLADLTKDRLQMEQKKRRKPFIFFVLLWNVFGTIFAILWDGCLRLIIRRSRRVKKS